MRTDVAIIGAGGHSKVILSAILEQASYNPQVFDSNPKVTNKLIFGSIEVSHLSNYDSLPNLYHVAIGDNVVRSEIFKKMDSYNKEAINIYHKLASISDYCTLGRGTFVASLAIIAPQVNIGDGVIVNHGAIVDHDCCVGQFSHLAPGVILGGGVSVGRKCLIGSGARILPGLRIGDNSTVGAGSIVTNDIGNNQTVMGIPAKSI